VKARFVGDPNDNYSGPEQITCWGVEFVKGEWTPVADKRFGRHSHFEFDADDDGEPDLSVEEMRAVLDLAGVKYHPRLGAAKLAEMVKEVGA
jgi:hypothetical protein